MGLDLYLCPMDYLSDTAVMGSTGWGYTHTILNCPRTSKLFVDLKNADFPEIPEGMDISGYLSKIEDGKHQGEHGYGRLPAKDPYGDPLTWGESNVLYSIFIYFLPDHPITAYLGALEPRTKVILYWH